ncbi:MAG: glycine cleavage system protein GcvH [Cytophagaceae bacterium]
MSFPEDYYYTQEHEWLRIDGEYAFIGITDFAQKELGDIVFIEVETLNQIVEKNGVLGTIEAVKTVSDVFCPVTAEIIELNEKIIKNPELINQYPYLEGWIVKVKICFPEQCNDLLNFKNYKALIGK